MALNRTEELGATLDDVVLSEAFEVPEDGDKRLMQQFQQAVLGVAPAINIRRDYIGHN